MATIDVRWLLTLITDGPPPKAISPASRRATDIDKVDRPKEPKRVGAARSEFERAVRSGTLSALRPLHPTVEDHKPRRITGDNLRYYSRGRRYLIVCALVRN